jgi:leucyl-tRNA---protein transferase
MINDIHLLSEISGAQLDSYLARGWYRLGQVVFTTDHVPDGSTMKPAFWLRYDLSRLEYGRKQRELLRRNARFTVTMRPLELTAELEELYQRYRVCMAFDASPTAYSYLIEAGTPFPPQRIIFDSTMIEIRDGSKLIALGVFDLGESTLAGILNFYDPEYKKYSLGKFLMLLKINHARTLGKAWYYPGYIAYGYTKFDYKLYPDARAAEIYDMGTARWLPYTETLLGELIGRPPAYSHTGHPAITIVFTPPR